MISRVFKNESRRKRRGGFFLMRKFSKIVSVFVIVSLLSFSIPNTSFARQSGGGDLAEADMGRVAMNAAISMGSVMVGSFAAQAVSTGTVNFANTIGSVTNWANAYNIGLAAGQVQGAVVRAGQYYGWNPRATLAASAFAGSVTAGGIGGVTGGMSSIAGGMAWGAVDGAVTAGVLFAASDSQGRVDPWVGPVAGLAGSVVSSGLSGFVSGGLDKGVSDMMGTLVYSLPDTALNVGINYIAETASDEDKDTIKAALSGLPSAYREYMRYENEKKKKVSGDKEDKQSSSGFRLYSDQYNNTPDVSRPNSSFSLPTPGNLQNTEILNPNSLKTPAAVPEFKVDVKAGND